MTKEGIIAIIGTTDTGQYFALTPKFSNHIIFAGPGSPSVIADIQSQLELTAEVRRLQGLSDTIQPEHVKFIMLTIEACEQFLRNGAAAGGIIYTIFHTPTLLKPGQGWDFVSFLADGRFVSYEGGREICGTTNHT